MEYHNRGRKQINLMPKLFAMMNKKQTNSAILAGIAISAILVTSSLITGSQLSQQAFAQAPPRPTPTPSGPTLGTATPSAPTSGGGAAANPAASPIGKNVVLSGTVASTVSPLAGHGKEQAAVILPLRKDGAVYTGVLTFTASKGVQVELWHEVTGVSPSTPIPKQFGAIPVSVSPTGKGIISTALVPSSSATSGSIPFTGNAVALHGSGSSPFIATYSVTAQTSQPQVMNNVTSATAAATLGGAAGAQLGGGTAAPALGGALGGAAGGGTSGGAGGTSGGGDTGTSGGGDTGTSGGG
jgi:hypothetical protein